MAISFCIKLKEFRWAQIQHQKIQLSLCMSQNQNTWISLKKLTTKKPKHTQIPTDSLMMGLLLGLSSHHTPQEMYGLSWSETTLPDGSVNYLGAHIEIVNGYLNISIFDKAAEWNFPVIKYPHADSNAPYHQSAGVFQGQLSRFRIVCSAIKFFKIATTELTRKMLFRKHKALTLIKGWNKHLA